MGLMVTVSVREDEAPTEQVERASDLLRDVLLELEVDSVRRLTHGEAPPGSRGVDLAAIGGMLVSLPATPGMLSGLIDAIRNWLRRPGSEAVPRSVRIEIDGDVLELSHATSDQQSRLVDDWLQRRAYQSGGDGDADGGTT